MEFGSIGRIKTNRRRRTKKIPWCITPPYILKIQKRIYICKGIDALTEGDECRYDTSIEVLQDKGMEKILEWISHSAFILVDRDRRFTVEQRSSNLSVEKDAVGSFRQTPQPLLSLVLRNDGPQEDIQRKPLLLACLKRRLAGSILIHREAEYQTRFRITESDQTYDLSSQSITARNQERLLLFMILPSTKITILDGPKRVRQHDSSNATETQASKVIENALRICQVVQQTPLDVPRTFLLSGPPGVGKTYSIQRALDSSEDTVDYISVRGSELILSIEDFRQSPIFNAAATIGKGKTTLVYLDEIDALLQSNLASSSIAAMLDNLQSTRNIVLVAATNRPDSVPSNLRRPGRIESEIAFAPPNAESRFSIIKRLVAELAEHVHIPEPDLHEIAEDTIGYVPADLQALLRKACIRSIQDNTSLSSSHIRDAMNEVSPSALRDAEISAPSLVSFDDVKGDPGGAKTLLRQAIEWPRQRARAYKALNLSPPRGILLYGPPGCAKTTLARAVAASSGVSFLSLSPADVFASSFVGDAEAIIRNAFTLARSVAPCVLFFDEIDAVVGSEGSNINMERNSSAEARILSTFLNEMDGVDGSLKDGVLVLGATNRPWALDAALLRFGRFDNLILVPPPDKDAREELFCNHFGTDLTDRSIISSLVDLSMDFTGAEIVGACQEASIRELRMVLESDTISTDRPKLLRETLGNVIPLLSNPAVMERYNLFSETRS